MLCRAEALQLTAKNCRPQAVSQQFGIGPKLL